MSDYLYYISTCEYSQFSKLLLVYTDIRVYMHSVTFSTLSVLRFSVLEPYLSLHCYI